jgi:DNA-binding LacI/PurR family transcriptional regulator
MDDVAARAGVSRALVSMAFRGLKGVAAEKQRRIFSAAEELGYRHNAIAARLASRRTGTMGLFLLDLYNEVFADILTGVRAATAEAGVKVVLSVGDPSRDGERGEVESLLDMRVDSAVIAGSLLPDKELVEIGAQVPVVSVTRLVPGIDSVATDDRLGGRLAAEHLIGLGHRSIAYLAPPTGPLYSDRERGYRDVLDAAGLRPRVVRSDFTQHGAAAVAAGLLGSADRPTAIFANNDVMALGVLEAAVELGLDVPGELSVVGYDDTRLAALPGVWLTSVNQQARRLGELAGERAIRRTSDGPATVQHTLLDPSLVLRRTTAHPSRIAR